MNLKTFRELTREMPDEVELFVNLGHQARSILASIIELPENGQKMRLCLSKKGPENSLFVDHACAQMRSINGDLIAWSLFTGPFTEQEL